MVYQGTMAVANAIEPTDEYIHESIHRIQWKDVGIWIQQQADG
jgi:hypothetical protein